MVSPARSAAFQALLQYRRNHQISRLSCTLDSDRRLAERIFFGVLQNERYLDWCLEQLIPRGYQRLHPALLDLLRLSAYQLLFLNKIPDSAIVNDAVSLCRKSAFSYSSGMTNAVLRNLSGRRDDFLSQQPELSVRYSHPDWMVTRLLERFGEPFTRALLSANQQIPEIHLQVNTRRCSLEQYCRLLQERHLSPVSVQEAFPSVHVSSTPVENLPGFREGFFYVQDDAARTSVRLAEIQPEMPVLDLCAAPGGKSIAAVLDGGVPLSCDISRERLKRCLENYQRLHMDIQVREADAREPVPEWFDLYPVVLADVPCSGTGVIRKHPEIRRKSESDFLSLLSLQHDILASASHYVSPGGILIYSTCSVMREENEDQVERFLREHGNFMLEPVPSESDPCQNGMFHSWTHLNGNDGFFAAKLKKHDESSLPSSG